jgi:hypothetical protein
VLAAAFAWARPELAGGATAPRTDRSVTFDLAAAQGALELCQGDGVRFTGIATGKPPLTYTWRVVSSGGTTVATLVGATAVWTTAGVAPGTYSAYLDVRNSVRATTSAPLVVLLKAAPLSFQDGFETGTVPWLSTAP